MHILIIPSEEFLPGNSTTVGIFQYHQAKVLKEAGHKVGVVSVGQSFSYPMIVKGLFFKLFGKKAGNACDDYSFGELLKLGYKKTVRLQAFIRPETVRGIDVLRIDGFYYLPPVENKTHVGWIKAGMAVYEEYVRRNGKPEVIHAHNAIYAGMLAKEIKLKHGIPYVITEHSTVFARNAITDARIISRIKEAYNHAAVLTCVSQPFCNLLNKQFLFTRFQRLHNVLDPDFESRKYIPGIEENKNFVFINIAELHPKKDHASLIKAFKAVYVKHPNVRLHIGGDGDLADELKVLVTKENLQEAVTFLGLLKREEVFEALRNADCFVLTSKYETFGVVVIEAMLLGKPVIATCCGGPESFVTPETGLIIEKENGEQLVSAMMNMVTGIGNYNGENIRQLAITNFGAAAFEKAAVRYYEEATKRPVLNQTAAGKQVKEDVFA